MIKTGPGVFFDNIIKSFMKNIMVQISRLKEAGLVSNLSVRCDKVNALKQVHHILSHMIGRNIKNATINPNNIDDRYFQ